MEYAKKYPQCAECPTLLALQNTRDESEQELEQIAMDTRMDNAELEYYAELVRQTYEEKINDMLEHGALEIDSSVIDIRERYEAMLQKVAEYIHRSEQFVNDSSTDLIDQLDNRVGYIASRCDSGVIRQGDIGRHALRCGTNAKHSDIPPLNPSSDQNDY
jgi:ElaB/YqjD/DUF883 family membrane-anchored ribosome-binding protein